MALNEKPVERELKLEKKLNMCKCSKPKPAFSQCILNIFFLSKMTIREIRGFIDLFDERRF